MFHLTVFACIWIIYIYNFLVHQQIGLTLPAAESVWIKIQPHDFMGECYVFLSIDSKCFLKKIVGTPFSGHPLKFFLAASLNDRQILLSADITSDAIYFYLRVLSSVTRLFSFLLSSLWWPLWFRPGHIIQNYRY